MSDSHINNWPLIKEVRSNRGEPLSPLVELLNEGETNLTQIYTMALLIYYDKLGEDNYDYDISLRGSRLTIMKDGKFPYVLKIFQHEDQWQVSANYTDPCYCLLYDSLTYGYNILRKPFSDN